MMTHKCPACGEDCNAEKLRLVIRLQRAEIARLRGKLDRSDARVAEVLARMERTIATLDTLITP